MASGQEAKRRVFTVSSAPLGFARAGPYSDGLNSSRFPAPAVSSRLALTTPSSVFSLLPQNCSSEGFQAPLGREGGEDEI